MGQFLEGQLLPVSWCQKGMSLCFRPGSNRRPCACEAHVITTTLRKPVIMGPEFELILIAIGPVAQRITRLTTDQKIAGSNPAWVVWHSFWPLVAPPRVADPFAPILGS